MLLIKSCKDVDVVSELLFVKKIINAGVRDGGGGVCSRSNKKGANAKSKELTRLVRTSEYNRWSRKYRRVVVVKYNSR